MPDDPAQRLVHRAHRGLRVPRLAGQLTGVHAAVAVDANVRAPLGVRSLLIQETALQTHLRVADAKADPVDTRARPGKSMPSLTLPRPRRTRRRRGAARRPPPSSGRAVRDDSRWRWRFKLSPAGAELAKAANSLSRGSPRTWRTRSRRSACRGRARTRTRASPYEEEHQQPIRHDAREVDDGVRARLYTRRCPEPVAAVQPLPDGPTGTTPHTWSGAMTCGFSKRTGRIATCLRAGHRAQRSG